MSITLGQHQLTQQISGLLAILTNSIAITLSAIHFPVCKCKTEWSNLKAGPARPGPARPTSLKSGPAKPKNRPAGPGRFLGLAARWISTFYSKGGAITCLYVANIAVILCYILG